MNSPSDYIIDQKVSSEWIHAPATRKLFSALNTQTITTRAVGGAVRNTLLNKAVKDIDFATTAKPEEILKLAELSGLKTIPTGLKHGTVTVLIEDSPFEVTTLRQDLETDGRRAKVEFTNNWKADASRRDFTINALYADADGNIYDPVQGYEDIQNNNIRFIGKARQRIQEDYLRILRFFRFIAEYDMKISDKSSLLACVQERAGLSSLSAERISVELEKLIIGPNADNTIQLMFSCGLLVNLLGLAVNPTRFSNLLSMEDRLQASPDTILRLAALSCYTREGANDLSKRLKLSNDKKRQLLTITNKAYHKQADFGPEQAKHLLYNLGAKDYKFKIIFEWLQSDSDKDPKWQSLYNQAKNWTKPSFPINGSDLMQLGIEKGPTLGKTLKIVEHHWVDLDFQPTKKDLLDFTKTLIK